MSTFLDLQNGWYNGFLQGMGQSESSFQIIQPAPPIASGTADNATFWAYYNNIPPLSLTQEYVASGGNQFYNDYRGLMSALVPTRNIPVEENIGKDNYKKWHKYIKSLSKPPATPPTMNQMPTLFRNWAMINAPSVANIGSSDYAAILLDPIATAQNELALVYTDATGLPSAFDWALKYDDMVVQLNASPSRSFNFSSSTMNSNVSSSWTKGSNSGFFGLWGSSSTTSSISEQFSSSQITVNASFDNVMVYSNTPGNWYYSSAMGLAYANKTGNPWSDSSINWDNTFGAPKGNMQRFAANLIIASGMSVTVTSDASYSTLDQQTITSSGSSGFWPFYCGSGGSSSTNKAAFNKQGQMTITTSSVKGVPVVLGVNVLPVGQFVGHSTALGVALYAAAKGFKVEKMEYEKYA
jgi:hypothetical protein